MERSPTKLQAPARGEVITSEFLEDTALRVNRNEAALAGPRDVSDEDDTNNGLTYTEVSRSTSTETVYDQNEENYAEIERIDSVTFENADGERITLVFNND